MSTPASATPASATPASATYTWKIERLDCYPTLETYENVVCTVHWRLFARSDDGFEATTYGSVALATSSLGPFTPYTELTEAQVVGWVRASLGPGVVGMYESTLAQNLQDQRAPPIVSPPLPWPAV